MTRARGGAAVIGCIGLFLLLGDLAYLVHDWHLGHDRFRFGVIGGLAMAVFIEVASRLLRTSEPIGADRGAARALARRRGKVFGPLAFVGYAVSFGLGINAALGMTAGLVVPLALAFAISGFREAINPKHAWHPKG
jgi:hypothetical protein